MSNTLLVKCVCLDDNVSLSLFSKASIEAQQRPDSRLVATVRDADDIIREFRHFTATASMPVVKWVSKCVCVVALRPCQ